MLSIFVNTNEMLSAFDSLQVGRGIICQSFFYHSWCHDSYVMLGHFSYSNKYKLFLVIDIRNATQSSSLCFYVGEEENELWVSSV